MYTERRFNGRLRNGQPDPASVANYIRVLTWQSVAEPSSFYFGWEDDGSPTSDDNFNDLVTWVSGIECSSGGQPCDTGLKGLCAKGTKQCRGGALTCVGDQSPVPEKCNAVDDNCDGNVDEGNPCDPGFVCFRGTCVPNCARGEFTCGAGSACENDAGVCVDIACKDKACPAGEVCRGGDCVCECDGIKCPFGQSCQHGGCVDVCSTLQCDNGFVCAPAFPDGAGKDPVGVCSNCGCQGCSAGTTCKDMHCVPNDCTMVMCGAGTHCEAGRCLDNCDGAKCPAGQKCDKGQCVLDPTSPVADAGREAAKEPPPIIITVGTTSSTSSTTGGMQSGTGGPATTGGNVNFDGPRSSGCGCRVPRGSTRGGSAVLLLLAIGGLARRRTSRPR
jgi:MYXO-CTERM domain-containing protein